MRTVVLCLLTAACATTPVGPPIATGEMLVRTRDPSVLNTRMVANATQREDVVVSRVRCRDDGLCTVHLSRLGAPTDEPWTREVVEAFAGAAPPEVESVSPRPIDGVPR
jgi:hypothetical protein